MFSVAQLIPDSTPGFSHARIAYASEFHDDRQGAIHKPENIREELAKIARSQEAKILARALAMLET